jgi:hypothetical protein
MFQQNSVNHTVTERNWFCQGRYLYLSKACLLKSLLELLSSTINNYVARDVSYSRLYSSPCVSRSQSLRAWRARQGSGAVLHNRSASASSRAFSVSYTELRTSSPRWSLISVSSIAITLPSVGVSFFIVVVFFCMVIGCLVTSIKSDRDHCLSNCAKLIVRDLLFKYLITVNSMNIILE